MLNVNKSIEGEKERKNQQGGMGKYKVAILLLCVFFNLCTILELKVEARTYSPLEREIEAKLKLLNKPAVKSIRVCNSITPPSQL